MCDISVKIAFEFQRISNKVDLNDFMQRLEKDTGSYYNDIVSIFF